MSFTADREIVISRIFNAPRELTFEAWSLPEHLDRWMGPRGFVTRTTSMDFRVGGEWRYTMTHAEYGHYLNRTRYLEIVPSERLVYDLDSGVDDGSEVYRVTVTFADLGGRTEVTMRTVCRTVEEAEAVKGRGAVEFGRQTLEKLGEVLDAEASLDLVIERRLSAPISRVWQAWTNPEQLGSWWGPKGLGLRVERFDLRPGGLFHYAMLPPGGAPPMWGRFHFCAIEPEHRLAWINSFADQRGEIIRAPIAPGFPLEIFNNMTLTPEGEGTRLLLRGRPIRATPGEREFFAGMHASMQGGFGGTFDQLVAWLASGA